MMLKKSLLLLMTAAALVLPGKEPFSIDFSQPLSQGKIKFSLKGKSVIRDGALYAADVARTTSSGAIAAKIYPELTPQSAFRLTAEFILEKPRSTQAYMMLWDNKGDFFDKKNGIPRDNSGFTVGIARSGTGKTFTPYAWLGFGKTTAVLKGTPFRFTPGKKHTLIFDYNGSGQAVFSVDGRRNAVRSVRPGGPLAPAHFRTVIGNRLVGHFFPFDGKLLKVTLAARPAEDLAFHLSGRKVFLRNEKNAALQVIVRNVSSRKTAGLQPGQSKTLRLPVNTRLSVGKYTVPFQYAGIKQHFEYRVGPVEHERMPVILWGYNDHYSHLQNAGFTHGLNSLVVRFLNRKYNQAVIEGSIDELDDMLYTGFRKMDYFNLVHFPAVSKKFPRLSREGKPIIVSRKMNVDANDPAAIKFLTDIAREAARFYGSHPALAMLDVNSEIRDRTAPSFSVHERAAYKKFSGKDIPEKVEGKTINFAALGDFPPDRIIADDHPYLVYYRWFWTVGDGWNPLHSKISETYHREIKHPFFSYFAPAARQPPITGAGGTTDMAGQWTYANPDPLLLTAAGDELMAVANGKPIIQGTQLICYRSASAPVNRKVANTPAWVKKHPKARYITIPPDALVESVWAMLSRPVQGMIFHGDGSFFPPPIRGASIYTMTNPETKPVFTKIIKEVVTPLGAALKRVPQQPSPVAILHSFSSAIFAGRGTYGWRGWPMDLHMALQWGGISPRVIYEEHLLKNDLKDVKVLLLPHCDILTEKVLSRINAFQRRGGIVIADETVPPAILPQIRIRSVSRFGKQPLAVKKELTALGKNIKKQLRKYWRPQVSSTDSDIITHQRGPYLFVINDKRTYGDYIGPWRLMAEKALPVKGKVIISKKVGAVYDPVARKRVPVRYSKGKTEIDTAFSGAGGKVYLLLDKPLASPRMTISKAGVITVDTRCRETLPVHLEVRDPAGRITDDTHYGAAVGGKFRYTLIPPENVPAGRWQIKFTVLPSGKSVSKVFTAK